MSTPDPEKTVGKLLLALQAVDPSWSLVRCSVYANPLDPNSQPVDAWALKQGNRWFCRGFDLSGLLLDFVEACRDRSYSAGNGWRVPGALRDAADVDDLAFRLEVLV